MTSHRPIVTAALALAALVVTIAPAGAQTIRHRDARHDVIRTGFNSTAKYVLAPNRREGDITAVRATYSRHSLFLSMRFRKLSLVKRLQWHYFGIVTSDGRVRAAIVNSGRRYPHGTSALMNNDDKYLRCRVHHRVSYRRALVSIRIPARCLGTPDWVRVGFGEASIPRNLFGDGPVFQDDGYLKGTPANADNNDITYGPKVHRG